MPDMYVHSVLTNEVFGKESWLELERCVQSAQHISIHTDATPGHMYPENCDRGLVGKIFLLMIKILSQLS